VHRHQHFDLWLEDDDELAELLGSRIAERTPLHEWPLSCVQRLRLADGRSLVYKVQGEPTVEPDFYARARSPLLVAAQRIERGAGPAALLLEDVAAPALSDRRLAEAEAARAVGEVLSAIAAVEGDPPVYADVRGEVRWAAFAARMLNNLRVIGHSALDAVARAAESAEVLAAVADEPGLVHTDLKAAHVFVLPDGYRVLDWQRPIRGPVALDRATLLSWLGVDPRGRVAPGVLALRNLLLIAWWANPLGPHNAEIARLAAELPR
jgi:hypothetical protein